MGFALQVSFLVLQAVAVLVNLFVVGRLYKKSSMITRQTSSSHLLLLLLCLVNLCWCVPSLVGSIVVINSSALVLQGPACGLQAFFAVFGFLSTLAIVALMAYYANRLIEGIPIQRYAVITASCLLLVTAVLLSGLPVLSIGSYSPNADLTFCFLDWDTPIASVILTIFVLSALFMSTTSYVRLFWFVQRATYHNLPLAETVHEEIPSTGVLVAPSIELATEATKEIEPFVFTITLRKILILLAMVACLWIGFILVIYIALQHLRNSGSDLPVAIYSVALFLAFAQPIINPIIYSTIWLKWFTNPNVL